jgi:hypothetical protein
MSDDKKIGDKELAAISVSVILFGGLVFHWVAELLNYSIIHWCFSAL